MMSVQIFNEGYSTEYNENVETVMKSLFSVFKSGLTDSGLSTKCM